MTRRGRLPAPGSRLPAWLATSLAALGVVLLGSVTTFTQTRADRSHAPALGPTPQLKVPPIQKRTLANGLPVWIVEQHEVPLVQVNLVIHSGSGDDPANGFGLASFTAAMLDEGAGTRTALQIADDVEFLGASLGTSSSFDASAVRLNVPVRQLRPALALMADVALRPTFPPSRTTFRRHRCCGHRTPANPSHIAAKQVRRPAPFVSPLRPRLPVDCFSHNLEANG